MICCTTFCCFVQLLFIIRWSRRDENARFLGSRAFVDACFSLQKMTFLGLELWTTNRDMIVLGENSCGKRPSSNYKRRPHDSPCLGKSLWRPEAANHTPRPNGDRLPFDYSMRFGWFLTRFRFTWFDAGVNFSSCGSSLVRAGANHGLHADDHMLLQGSYHSSWGYQTSLLCEPRQDLYLDLTDATSKSTSPKIFLMFSQISDLAIEPQRIRALR